MNRDHLIPTFRLPTRLAVWLAFLVFLTIVGLNVHRADAADATVSWTHPVAFADGTPLAVSQIASTRVEWGTCSGSAFGTASGSVSVNAPAAQAVVTGLTPGTWCFRAYTRVVAAAGGLESVPSMVAQRTIAFPPPNPPTLVTVATTAKLVNPSTNTVAYQVGTVAKGIGCGVIVVEGATRDWATVERQSVKLNWLGRLLNEQAVIVAPCA